MDHVELFGWLGSETGIWAGDASTISIYMGRKISFRQVLIHISLSRRTHFLS